MEKWKTIQIDIDVHKRLEEERRSFNETENDILRRILLIPVPSRSTKVKIDGETVRVLRMRPNNTLSFHNAAVKVLEDEGAPLHYEEITKRVREKGLIKTSGATPTRTMSATLTTDLKTSNPTFERYGPGFYGLRKWKRTNGDQY